MLATAAIVQMRCYGQSGSGAILPVTAAGGEFLSSAFARRFLGVLRRGSVDLVHGRVSQMPRKLLALKWDTTVCNCPLKSYQQPTMCETAVGKGFQLQLRDRDSDGGLRQPAL